MPSQEIKTKNPLGASDEHMENFAAAFTQCFYDWLPKVNETVACLYLPTFNGDGVILGAIKT